MFSLLLRDRMYEPRLLAIENKDGNNALIQAVNNRNFDLLMEMEAAEADLTYESIQGNNLLHFACMTGHRQIIRYLIEKYDLDPSAKNEDGISCLAMCPDGPTS